MKTFLLIVSFWLTCAHSQSALTSGKILKQIGEFQLSIGTCQKKNCPILIAPSSHPKNSASLGWPALEPVQISETGNTISTGGDESSSPQLKTQSMKLDVKTQGLLISMEAGFEHVKRRHEVWI